MSEDLSVCGCECPQCEYFIKLECAGCSEIRGKVWWIKHISADICPIYDCVVNVKNYNNCGNCVEMPCALWRDLKDPSHTDEQHETDIKNRVEILRKLTY